MRPLVDRFLVSAVGPFGGSSTRFGGREASAYFTAEGGYPAILVLGTLDANGRRCVTITARQGDRSRTLYSGPLASILDDLPLEPADSSTPGEDR